MNTQRLSRDQQNPFHKSLQETGIRRSNAARLHKVRSKSVELGGNPASNTLIIFHQVHLSNRELLSPASPADLIVFPPSRGVVINQYGAFVPRIIFGSADIAYEYAVSQTGDLQVILRAKKTPANPVTPRPRFGSAQGLISMSDDFDEPIEDFEDYM